MKKRKETKERDGLLLEGFRRRRAEGEDWPVNVWEWCEDVYDAEFYSKPEASGMNPISQAGSEYRVLRGGSWIYVAWDCRSSYRGKLLPADRNLDLGFRPACRLP